MPEPRSWFTSSFSGGGNCVEVKIEPQQVLVRDTKDRAGGLLTFTHDEWSAFLRGAAHREFDLPSAS